MTQPETKAPNTSLPRQLAARASTYGKKVYTKAPACPDSIQQPYNELRCRAAKCARTRFRRRQMCAISAHIPCEKNEPSAGKRSLHMPTPEEIAGCRFITGTGRRLASIFTQSQFSTPKSVFENRLVEPYFGAIGSRDRILAPSSRQKALPTPSRPRVDLTARFSNTFPWAIVRSRSRCGFERIDAYGGINRAPQTGVGQTPFSAARNRRVLRIGDPHPLHVV